MWISRFDKVTNFAQSTLLPVLIVSVTDGAQLYSSLKKSVHFTKILEYLVVLNLNKVSQLFAHLYLTLYFKYLRKNRGFLLFPIVNRNTDSVTHIIYQSQYGIHNDYTTTVVKLLCSN